MSAAYDTYDYPSYWKGRQYEHQAEVYALRNLLNKIPSCARALEIGAGFGRLVPEYELKAKEVIISDPSSKLLSIAKNKSHSKRIKFIKSSLENLDKKIRTRSVDLVILVRVLHHLQNTQEAFRVINRILVPGGYFILEFPNKVNFKASIRELFRGNITYPIDISSKEIRSKTKRREPCLPFYNYHPDKIRLLLGNANFSVIENASVSNIRSTHIKKILPTKVLMFLEKPLQRLLAPFDFGPSVFILAQKKRVIPDYIS